MLAMTKSEGAQNDLTLLSLRGWRSQPKQSRGGVMSLLRGVYSFDFAFIEYNSHRPQQSLAYLTPVEHIEKALAKIRSPLSPMWSATISCRCALIEFVV